MRIVIPILCIVFVILVIYSVIKNKGKENPPSKSEVRKPSSIGGSYSQSVKSADSYDRMGTSGGGSAYSESAVSSDSLEKPYAKTPEPAPVPKKTEQKPVEEKPKKSFFERRKKAEPKPAPVETAPGAIQPQFSSTYAGDIRLTRLGQSSVMIKIADKTILIDPALTDKKAGNALPDTKFAKAAERISELPHITAILLTHEHLEPSIYKKADDKVEYYIVPKGVDQHLQRGNIASEKIVVMSWWQKDRIGNIEFICAPSRNMSGRSLVDKGHEKWCSWIIRADGYQIYDSGDGDYGLHFDDDTQAKLPEKPKNSSADEITAAVTRSGKRR